ncbi:Insertion element IS1223 uncharacterized 20.7 kDa protein [Lactobacillus helsingborgensis]|nr:Insertion element IS1223 uncharacterized 20.7 kDa protein [Lactobacillus helsingborgensis]
MTKYSTALKMEICSKYLSHQTSLAKLEREYGIDHTEIRAWAERARKHGLAALKVTHTRQTYLPEFKLNVVRFYHEHHMGIHKVAAVFKLNSSQVQAWLKLYQAEGYAGLFPKPKGRPPTMTKKKRQKKLKPAKKLTEVEQLRKQVAELEAQKADLELNNLILKKVAARYPRLPTGKKPE